MLTITLLGTAATMPLPDRALSTAFAACGGHGLLFDCGEGTQAAARRAGVNLMRADAVCLTHYHGDHIFGLPGLLQTLGAQGRTRPLLLVGPKGLAGIWSAVRALTGPLPYAVRLQEADGPAGTGCAVGGLAGGCCAAPLCHPAPGCPVWVIGWSCPGQAGSTRPGPGRWGCGAAMETSAAGAERSRERPHRGPGGGAGRAAPGAEHGILRRHGPLRRAGAGRTGR